MPESVLVRFSGEMQPGITLRDLVHAIPYAAIKSGDLTVPKKNKKNIFAGRVLEIEGVNTLKCEQAFELSDASAERSAAGCTVKLDKEPIAEYLTSNIVMLKWMIAEGYGDARTIKRRIASMEAWLANPVLMEADKGAQYHKIFDIDLAKISEPILCCPNDPDDAKTLTEIGSQKLSSLQKASTASMARWELAQRCRAAPSAWATRRGLQTRPMWSPHLQEISRTVWARALMCTWQAQSSLPSQRSWEGCPPKRST